MKVLLLSSAPFLPSLARPRLLAAALRAAGVTVLERRVPIRTGGGSRAGALRGAAAMALEAGRAARALARLAREAARREAGIDAVLVPYGGTLDPLLARLAGRRCGGVPVVVDAFLSLHESAVEDRRVVRPGSRVARALAALDRLAVRCADLLVVDTEETGKLFVDRYGADPARVVPVPVGSDLAAPPPVARDGVARVLFVGTGIPFHGVGHILNAFARLARPLPGVELVLVGGTVADRESASGRTNVRVVEGPVDRRQLARLHAEADVVLGVFGEGAKADRVVPCKVYDALACGRAVVTGSGRAVRRILAGIGGVEFVPRGDGEALARALGRFVSEPERAARMGRENRLAFEARFSLRAIGTALARGIEVLRRSRSPRSSLARTVPT